MRLKNRVGEKNVTNQGYEIEIVEYTNNTSCFIKFKGSLLLHKVTYQSFKNGSIKNHNHKSVFGIGFLGEGKYISGTSSKISKDYQSWNSMLGRCADTKIQNRQPTYVTCSVDERWHNFQNFAKWHEENCNPEIMKEWHLDKDILVKGNKIYSPETCCLVPPEINTLFTKNTLKRGDYPIGVSKIGYKYLSQMSKNGISFKIGTFDTIEEAFQAYKSEKEAYIKEVAKIWKGKIVEKVYQALINYKVGITD